MKMAFIPSRIPMLPHAHSIHANHTRAKDSNGGHGEGARCYRKTTFRRTMGARFPVRNGSLRMRLNNNAIATHFVSMFARSRVLLVHFVHALIEARTRSIEGERRFYQSLDAYCRANNLSSVCEDDWKTAAYADRHVRQSTSKGAVS